MIRQAILLTVYQQDTLDKGVEMRFNLLHADWSPSIQSRGHRVVFTSG